MTLKDRCEKMLNELSIPVTSFCRHLGVSPSAYYSWRKGTLVFSAKTIERIENYIKKYGF